MSNSQPIPLCDNFALPGYDYDTILAAAREYATTAHERVDHRRKYSNLPYYVHPAQTGLYVAQSIHNDAVTIAVARLHDVLEDTLREGQTTKDGADEMLAWFTTRIGAELAAEIVKGVLEVTDVSVPSDGNRKFRKNMDAEHAGRATPERKTVKLADIKSNFPSIVKNDPGFARKWVAEKQNVLPLLQGGDPALFKEVKGMIDAYYARTFNPDAYDIV